VHNGMRQWTVARRYSEFRSLHTSLSAEFPNTRLPKMPPKKYIGVMDPRFVAERKEALMRYMNELVQVPAVWQSNDLISFLDDSANSLGIQVTLERMQQRVVSLEQVCADHQHQLRRYDQLFRRQVSVMERMKVCVCVSLSLSVCVWLCVAVCGCVWLWLCVCVCVFVSVCLCLCVCVCVCVVASWHRRVSRPCGPRVAMLTAVSPGWLLRSAASWPSSHTRACTTPPTPSRRLSRPCPRLRPSRRRAQASPRAPHRPPPATPTTTALLRRRPAATA